MVQSQDLVHSALSFNLMAGFFFLSQGGTFQSLGWENSHYQGAYKNHCQHLGTGSQDQDLNT